MPLPPPPPPPQRRTPAAAPPSPPSQPAYQPPQYQAPHAPGHVPSGQNNARLQPAPAPAPAVEPAPGTDPAGPTGDDYWKSLAKNKKLPKAVDEDRRPFNWKMFSVIAGIAVAAVAVVVLGMIFIPRVFGWDQVDTGRAIKAASSGAPEDILYINLSKVASTPFGAVIKSRLPYLYSITDADAKAQEVSRDLMELLVVSVDPQRSIWVFRYSSTRLPPGAEDATEKIAGFECRAWSFGSKKGHCAKLANGVYALAPSRERLTSFLNRYHDRNGYVPDSQTFSYNAVSSSDLFNVSAPPARKPDDPPLKDMGHSLGLKFLPERFDIVCVYPNETVEDAVKLAQNFEARIFSRNVPLWGTSLQVADIARDIKSDGKFVTIRGSETYAILDKGK